MRRLFVTVACVAAVAAVAVGIAAAFNPDTLVSVGSPTGPFSQNKQNEPALAVDASHPNVLVAGSNDEIDMEVVQCHRAASMSASHRTAASVSGFDPSTYGRF